MDHFGQEATTTTTYKVRFLLTLTDQKMTTWPSLRLLLCFGMSIGFFLLAAFREYYSLLSHDIRYYKECSLANVIVAVYLFVCK